MGQPVLLAPLVGRSSGSAPARAATGVRPRVSTAHAVPATDPGFGLPLALRPLLSQRARSSDASHASRRWCEKARPRGMMMRMCSRRLSRQQPQHHHARRCLLPAPPPRRPLKQVMWTCRRRAHCHRRTMRTLTRSRRRTRVTAGPRCSTTACRNRRDTLFICPVPGPA